MGGQCWSEPHAMQALTTSFVACLQAMYKQHHQTAHSPAGISLDVFILEVPMTARKATAAQKVLLGHEDLKQNGLASFLMKVTHS